MTPFVQRFIENNILFIETYEYDRLIDRWCAAARHANPYEYKDNMFMELVTILDKTLHIDLLALTEESRKDELEYDINKIVESFYNIYGDEFRAREGKEWFIDRIPTTLGFDQDEIITMCDNIADYNGIGVTQNYYYIKQ